MKEWRDKKEWKKKRQKRMGIKWKKGSRKKRKKRSHQGLFLYSYLGRILNSLRDKPETCQSGVVPELQWQRFMTRT